MEEWQTDRQTDTREGGKQCILNQLYKNCGSRKVHVLDVKQRDINAHYRKIHPKTRAVETNLTSPEGPWLLSFNITILLKLSPRQPNAWKEIMFKSCPCSGKLSNNDRCQHRLKQHNHVKRENQYQCLACHCFREAGQFFIISTEGPINK